MKPKILSGWLLLLALLLSACFPIEQEPAVSTLDPTALYRFAEETVAVSASKTVAAYSPTPPKLPTATLPPPATLVPTLTATLRPSSTPLPTFTPFPSVTPMPTVDPNLPACNLAAFVDDVTIPDGTQMEANAGFIKTWRVRNVGSCTWTKDYSLAFVRGDSMGGPTSITLPGDTAPGDTVDLTINFTAPGNDGSYKAVYQLMDADGKIFGSKLTSEFGVQVVIRVGSPPAAFAVTSVNMSVDQSTVTTACPPGKTFAFDAEIVTNGPGTVKYHWVFSNGDTTAVETLNYKTAGPNVVHATWALGTSKTLPANPYSGWAQVYIDEPNHQAFGQQPFLLGCLFAP